MYQVQMSRLMFNLSISLFNHFSFILFSIPFMCVCVYVCVCLFSFNLLVNYFPKIFPYNILICNSLPQSHLRIRQNELHPVCDLFLSFLPPNSFIHSFLFFFFLSLLFPFYTFLSIFSRIFFKSKSKLKERQQGFHMLPICYYRCTMF